MALEPFSATHFNRHLGNYEKLLCLGLRRFFHEDFSFKVFDVAFIMLKFFFQHDVPEISDSMVRNNDKVFCVGSLPAHMYNSICLGKVTLSQCGFKWSLLN